MEALKALEEVAATHGATVRARKEGGEDTTEALAALAAAKTALKDAIDALLPSVEIGSADYHALREKLLPLLTDKAAKKKLEKDIKAAKKASPPAAAAAAASAPPAQKKATKPPQGAGAAADDDDVDDGGAAAAAGEAKQGKKPPAATGGGGDKKDGKAASKASSGPVQVPAVCRQLLVAQVADLQNGGVHMCLAAATLAGANLDALRVCVVADVPKHERFLYPALRLDMATTLHGRSAVCRYLLAATPLSLLADNAADWAVQVLAPVLAAGDPARTAAVVAELGDSVVSAEGRFFVGDTATLADVMLACTLAAAGAGASSDRLQNVQAEPWFASSRREATALLAQYTSPKLRESLESAVSCTLNALPALQEALMRGADVDVRATVGLRRAVRKPAHFQMDFALKLVSVFKAFCAGPVPPELSSSQLLAAHVLALAPADARVESFSLSGPGFISVIMAKECLSDLLQAVLERGVEAPVTVPARVCVDYSSPNIAKDMHVGHLRSTIIGDSLCRVLEFCGDEVTRINHLGDWGTQFGMLIAHLKQTFPDFLTNTPEVRELTEFYKAAKIRFSEEEGFKKVAHDEVVALQAGDETNIRLWRALCAVSERMFQDLYRRLGISDKLEAKGESFYQSRINPLLEELEAKGLLVDDSGMKCMKVEGEAIPLIVRKSDGGFGYDATDLAAIRYRFVECGFDRAVYVVDAGQSLHFSLVFGGAKRAGWLAGGKVAEHCKFGLVCGDDGKRYRTRDGGVVRLVDLLDEGRDRALATLNARAAEGTGRAEGDEAAMLQTAEAIAYSGVKYFDLNRDRLKDYIFSYEAMLNPNGDTAVYLQYAHARMSSILRKSGKDIQAVQARTRIALVDEAEVDLAMEVLSLTYVLSLVRRDLQLLPLCKWLRDLCVQFSTFVNQCRVLGSENEDSRLLVVHATASAMRHAMGLLGMQVVEKL
jgi:arginyl-tRNA synthetase